MARSLLLVTLFISLFNFQLTYARPCKGTTIYPIQILDFDSDHHSPERTSISKEFRVGQKIVDVRPLIMSMLPKGKKPVSGPSQRINNQNN
ncbi:hypothetical protein F511_20719 [Dorcoceras hygrometricum]|uniref:Uncharacterized protein n=1 Tax=Dorcoceras hygrometricum TaxID=472368 RepID=A0A2Z7AUB0_9LAMI|nr:hypothetical protein F511_20719 [Dorcoceras hygrometricum]